jgi:hypothetical protein
MMLMSHLFGKTERDQKQFLGVSGTLDLKDALYMRVRIAAALVVLTFLGSAGCVVSVDPAVSTLDTSISGLPEITLVRRVTPERRTKETQIYWGAWQTEGATGSEFGGATDVADLSCVAEGLRKDHPEIEVVPTQTFWNQVAGGKDEITLSELFTSPLSNRWRELQIDVLVVAYHTVGDVKIIAAEIIMEGFYSYENRETAAVLAVDLRTRKGIHASQVILEQGVALYHFLVVPLPIVRNASSDPCRTIGEAAAQAISITDLPSAPRVAVVAAGSNPYHAAQVVWGKELEQQRQAEQERLVEQAEQACRLPFPEARNLDLPTQSELATTCGEFGPLVEWQWLCLAAHNGDSTAQYKIGGLYADGKEPVSQDLVKAYVWYSLAAASGFKMPEIKYIKTPSGGWTCCSPPEPPQRIIAWRLSPNEIGDAEHIVADWRPNPAECEAPPAQAAN